MIIIGVLVFLCAGIIFAQAKPKPGETGNHTESFGILFGIQSLDNPVDNSTDSVISGIGGKYWFSKEFVIRGLVFVNIVNLSATDELTTRFGVSAGAEYHFIDAVVSPYAGLFLGIEFLNDNAGPAADYHGGGMFGVEINALEYLSFYIEYTLTLTLNEQGFEVDLGYNHLPTFGVVIYIK